MKGISNKLKENPFYVYLFFYAVLLVVLSLFRNASDDEAYYLKETTLISELLGNGIWIGNYGVGLHGFLFKLPVAIIFLIIGRPSIFLATLFTIFLNISSLLLFYKILKTYFFKNKYAMWSGILLSVIFHFLQTSISFNRDIPAVFTVLLFLYLFLKNANNWFIGGSLLLMLDAKEHVFLTVAPLLGVYLLVKCISSIKVIGIWNSAKEFINKCFSGYIFSIIWIILMFTTSIIPINMFVASIFGGTQVGMDWNKSQFMTEIASQNLMEDDGKEIPQWTNVAYCEQRDDMVLTQTSVDDKDRLICVFVDVVNTIFSYVGKILYPRTFSFISIPKIIVLPALVHSILMFMRWWRKKDERLILPMILILNILAVILRASHGRYLLCIAPIVVIFFVMFIQDGLKRQKYFRNVLLATTVFAAAGLLFESTFLVQKIIMETGLLALLWGIWLFRKSKLEIFKLLKEIFLLALSLGMFLTNIAFSYKIGQISNYLKYGYNLETKEISEQFGKEEKLWINNYGSDDLISVYRESMFNEPEWSWELSDWIPKKDLLKIYSQNNTFSFAITDMPSFKNELFKYEIKKVTLIVSTIEGESFSEEDKLSEILSQDWLKFEKKINFKNKIMFIFEVEK